SFPAQGGSTNRTEPSGSLTRGTRTSRKHSCWKKFRCRYRLVCVSCTGCSPAHSGCVKRLPARKSTWMVNERASPSKRASRTNHGVATPSAASNNCSDCILSPPPPSKRVEATLRNPLRFRKRQIFFSPDNKCDIPLNDDTSGGFLLHPVGALALEALDLSRFDQLAARRRALVEQAVLEAAAHLGG